jgi:antitoxin component of RelBE/YafQ-DinJ toxin-antitoxin module
MSKIRKSCTSLSVRIIPSERKAIEQLADRLGCNISDVVKFSLYESFHKANIPFVDFEQPDHIQPVKNPR